MNPSEKASFLEFLRKDDEHWELTRLGFWKNPEQEARSWNEAGAARLSDESFVAWKYRVLRAYYQERNYSKFYRNSLLDRRFVFLVKRRLTLLLQRIFSDQERTQLDQYLANTDESLSYVVSAHHFDHLFLQYFLQEVDWVAPFEVQLQLEKLTDAEFPLSETEVMQRLRANDTHCWSIFYRHLKPYVIGLVRQIGGSFQMEDADEIWNEVCFVVNGALINGRLDEATGAKDLISYAVGVIRNKCRELCRIRSRQKRVDVESITYRLADDTESNLFDDESCIPANFPSHDTPVAHYVDAFDPDSVRATMILALYNQTHPLHEALVKGLEDEVAVLLEHYTEDMSYEALVQKYEGPVSKEEMIRLAARYRQMVKRVKNKLIQRYAGLIKARVE